VKIFEFRNLLIVRCFFVMLRGIPGAGKQVFDEIQN